MDGDVGFVEVFGFFDIEIVMIEMKYVILVEGVCVRIGEFIKGYEIYMGWIFGLDI